MRDYVVDIGRCCKAPALQALLAVRMSPEPPRPQFLPPVAVPPARSGPLAVPVQLLSRSIRIRFVPGAVAGLAGDLTAPRMTADFQMQSFVSLSLYALITSKVIGKSFSLAHAVMRGHKLDLMVARMS